MCAAPVQTAGLEGVNTAKETVIQGTIVADGQPLPGAFVRLLDANGDFTAEVESGPTGSFRFFAAPGTWNLRVLSGQGNADLTVAADRGLNDFTINVTG